MDILHLKYFYGYKMYKKERCKGRKEYGGTSAGNDGVDAIEEKLQSRRKADDWWVFANELRGKVEIGN